jgi:hypothetical protein
MADFQTVLNALAQVIGGTAPDLINHPTWYSGDQVQDGTGLQPGAGYPTFKGCYATPPDSLPDVPIGVFTIGPFTNEGPQARDTYFQGVEHAVDDLRLLILINRQDAQTTLPNLMPYRDLVPAAFASHMRAFATQYAVQVMARGGKPVSVTIGSVVFDGIEFTVRVLRVINRIYTA